MECQGKRTEKPRHEKKHQQRPYAMEGIYTRAGESTEHLAEGEWGWRMKRKAGLHIKVL